ncbi:hypothetical protein FK220_011875 [Flavobacteriaceae bacterium TP-CH-4]|uniref:LVIVD repeat-containing protein n=1 Tax=Pelagihabitans pacificus TaxID=2696054 RepID=A0A967E6W3_9FLAO|nr:hypothetical protein [Pelagihabitans pacificus]NHF60045.1 hypothetical protein [Pelagihabitans pacificus]
MKKLSLVALATMAFLVSCSDETTVYSDPKDDVVLEGDQSVLDNSISFDNSGVLDIFEQDKSTGRFSKSSNDGEAGDYPLTLVAQVNSPTYSGTLLTASHVDVEGDYAYVSYNTAGATYLGGVDAINISDPNNPRVTGRLYYTNADINAVKYDNGYVYIAGGFDSEKSATADFNSFVGKITVSNGRFDLGGGITYGFQEGFNATDVKVMGDKLLVASGKDGLLRVYDKNTVEMVQEVPFADLRAMAVKDNDIAILDGSHGVSLLDANLETKQDIAINSDFGDFSKRTLDFYEDKIIVSEGSKGAGVYDLSSGTLLEHVPILINPDGVDSSDIVTNAVAINEGVVLMANGGAGLCLSEDNGNNTDLVGIIELNGSINYVESKGDYAFAASGKSGLQIIKMNKPSASLVAACTETPIYEGSSNLSVDTGAILAYSGSKRFRTLNVNGSLLLCGSWTVREAVNINENAVFEMNGTLVVARNNKRRNVTLGEGATFRVEGNLTIYGDLILNEGATLEFLGANSVVNVFGDVVRNGNTEITGTFRDVQNKF